MKKHYLYTCGGDGHAFAGNLLVPDFTSRKRFKGGYGYYPLSAFSGLSRCANRNDPATRSDQRQSWKKTSATLLGISRIIKLLNG